MIMQIPGCVFYLVCKAEIHNPKARKSMSLREVSFVLVKETKKR